MDVVDMHVQAVLEYFEKPDHMPTMAFEIDDKPCAVQVANKLRESGIACEISERYKGPDSTELNRVMIYAHKTGGIEDNLNQP